MKNLPKRMRPKIDECPARPAAAMIGPDTLTLDIPIPPKQTHPNARVHWRYTLKPKKAQREQGYIASIEAMSKVGMLAKPPRWKSATILATFYRPGSNDRESDPGNLIRWMKATEDGIQDAGIIDNDRGFIWLPPIQVLGKEAGTRPRVELVITKAE